MEIEQKVKNIGKNKNQNYQILLVIFMSLIWIILTFASMIGSFVYMNPLF